MSLPLRWVVCVLALSLVFVPLKNGTLQRTTYNPGFNPMQNQFLMAPMLWRMSASAFKTVQLKERLAMRFNIDFLDNVFNMPGNNPNAIGSDGILSRRTSGQNSRELQLTLRLSW